MADSAADRIEFLRKVRTVRRFKQGDLPEAVIDDVVKVARWTGSASNTQPWEIVVVRDREKLEALAGAGGNVTSLKYAAAGIIIALTTPAENVARTYFDEGRLAERIMLAAAAHGVGSGIAWFRDQGGPTAKKLLGIPDDRTVRTAIYLGYSADEMPSGRGPIENPRKPLAEFASFDQYGKSK